MRRFRKAEPDRTELILEICRSALEPGHWDRLAPRTQEDLLGRWRPELEAWDTRFLQELADPQIGAPCVLIDDDLNLYYSRKNLHRAPQPASGAGRDPLRDFVREANRLETLVLGTDLDGTPVTMPMDNLDTHLAILGTTGVGKTVLASSLFVQLAARGGPMLLLDPHDDFIQTAIPNLPSERLADVVYIDPSDLGATWGINVLQLARDLVDESDPNYTALMQRMIDQSVSYIVDALSVLQEDTTGYQAGPSIRSLMRAGFMAASEREDTSLVDVYSLLTKSDVQGLVVPTLLRHHVRDYFQDTVRELNREYLERVRNKLEIFLDTILINTMCRRDECISIPEMLRQNKIVVVDLNRDRLSPTVSSLIGYLVLIITMFAIDRRELLPKSQQTPFYAFVAEFSNFASRIVSRWVSEARKKNAGIIMDFQHLAQLPDEVQDALGNVGTLAAFRPTDQDAPLLCKRLELTTETGHPLVHEMLQLPQHVMRLQFDEVDGQATRRITQRSIATVRGLPPLPLPRNHREILERAKRCSRRYWKPNQASDQRTVYSADAVGSRTVLSAVWAANLALRNPAQYVLQGANEKALWALQSGVATQTLILAILGAKGHQLARGHFRQILNSLREMDQIRVRKNAQGYLHTEPTQRGLDELARSLDPGTSRQEGSREHRNGILRLYTALSSWAPFPLHVPQQGVGAYTPDLAMVRLEGEGANPLVDALTKAKAVHFQFEHSVARRTKSLLRNLVGAQLAGADAIVVIPTATDPQRAVQDVRRVHNAIEMADREQKRMMPHPPGPTSPGDLSRFRVWALTSQARLFEYDRVSDRLVDVATRYAPSVADKQPKKDSGPAEMQPAAGSSPTGRKHPTGPLKASPGHGEPHMEAQSHSTEQPPPTVVGSSSEERADSQHLSKVRRALSNLIIQRNNESISQETALADLHAHPATRNAQPKHVDRVMRELQYRRRSKNGEVSYDPF